jgi:hypothetical protein
MRYTPQPMKTVAFAFVLITTLALAGCIKPGPPEYQGLPGGIVSANGDLAFTEEELQSFTRIPEHSDMGILLDPYQPQGALFDLGLTRDETTVVWPETVTQSGKGSLRSGEEFSVTATYDQNRLYHVAAMVDGGDLSLGVKAARACRLFGFTNFVSRMKQKAASGEGDMRELCLAGETYILNAYEREILIKLYVDVVPDESVTLGVYWAYEGDFEPIPEFKPPPPPPDSEERQREALEQREKQMEEAKRHAEEEGLPPPEMPGEPEKPEEPTG